MANITISDLAIAPVSESFITELDEHNINGIIGGTRTVTTTVSPNGEVKVVVKECTPPRPVIVIR
ncbi:MULTISPECIES: hypothetical protein [unclassified Moorena]|uniref:hypothetical protein n=1 Tax=unclassified Moorena TaxID=2683338 RepID=UPI0013FFD048|nr:MULTISPECIES: hypothetical protein [unclassified Moorena]NEO12618.1 hypothetical protein [Moorena sp. SIO3E8]NEP97670.1 hypothetical protein [Moorena sp. SIO3F7]